MPERVVRQAEIGAHYRSIEIERAAVDSESRTVALSFSSEAPVEQYDWDGRYYEILDHSKTSVQLDRLKSAAPLLMDHNRRDQVGVVEEATIGEDRKGRAKVRFSTSARGEEIFQDVKTGIRRLVSVGYRVYELVTEKIEGEVETLRAMRWEPFEISIVSVPADTTVGVGRDVNTESKNQVTINTMKLSQRNLDPSSGPAAGGGAPAAPPAPPVAPPAAPPAVPNIATGAGARADYQEMFSLAKRINSIPLFERAITEGWDLAEFRKQALESRASAPIPGVTATPPTIDAQQRSMSIGQRFVNSESYRQQRGKKGMRRSMVLEIPDECQFRSNPFSATDESLTSITKLPGVPGLLDQQPLRIAQLMAQGTTDGLTIRYIKEDTYTQAATAVAEGAAKPGASLDVSEVDATVRKIAVYTKITEEMADDFAQMQSYVNARLGYMVQSLEDVHLLSGTGGSNQIKGVLNFSGIQTVSVASYTVTADAILAGISYVRGANGSGFLEPDAVIIHPLDYLNLKLAKDSNGQYHGGGPFLGQYGVGGYTNVGSIWGLPAVITTSISRGTALTGAFRIASQIFRRMGLTIESTNSDQDDFIKNLMTIRAEERLALAVYKPDGFCTITNIPA